MILKIMFIIYKTFHTSLSEKSSKMVYTEGLYFVLKVMSIYTTKRPEGFTQTMIHTKWLDYR